MIDVLPSSLLIYYNIWPTIIRDVAKILVPTIGPKTVFYIVIRLNLSTLSLRIVRCQGLLEYRQTEETQIMFQ